MQATWRRLGLALCLTAAANVRADDPPAGAGDFPAPGEAPKAKKSTLAWAKSLDDALAQSKKSGKLVMVDFYTTWCGPCKMLERETYGDAKVAAALAKDYVVVKIDCESETGEPLAEKYKVEAFPTVLFLDGDGKVVHKHMGFAKPEPFLEKLSGLGDVKDLPKLLADAKKNPEDGAVAARVIGAHCMQGDLAKAKAFLENATSAGLAGDGLAKAFNKIGDAHQEQEEFDAAIGYFEKAAKAGKAREKGYALLSIGACQLSKDDLTAAKKSLQEGLAIPSLPADLKADGEKMLNEIKKAERAKDKDA